MYCEYTVVHVHLYMKKNTVVVKHKVKHKLYMYTVVEVCKRSIFSRSVYSLSAYSLVIYTVMFTINGWLFLPQNQSEVQV